MTHTIFVAVYLVLMGAIIVALDVLFLRQHFWWRLGTNIGIVVVFAIVYLVWLKNAFR
ncbi:hypothetical protein [Leifsonia aquatica]|uniref:hypothetical protein n=1 Tax=Leifsonia aquatica TaxID=144185 RepID=UPI000A40F202|nr:hypothetical protein [Leifsonia aquatica]